MSNSKKLERIEIDAGVIILPITRVDNGLCLRVQLGSLKNIGDNKSWDISYSGGAIVINVPGKMRHYTISMESIIRAVIEKEGK